MPKKKKKKLKIKFAPSVAIEGLQPYVDEVLDCLADVLDRPGARDAFVSDMSTINCFLDSKDTGKTSPHPFDKRKRCIVVTYDTPKNRKLVKEVSKRLGVPVGLRDYIYEVAIRVRDK